VQRSAQDGAPIRRSALLIVGHPGHELRVHGWLEAVRPLVMILTDGSGASGASRLASSDALIARAGAMPGSIYGRFADAALYQALLDHNAGVFTSLVDELADALADETIDLVAGDAAEGYNPTHDVCRMLIDAAVVVARRRRASPIASYAFPLIARPDTAAGQPGAVSLELDDEALARKLAAARAYAEMASEVESALKAVGPEAFRRECLAPVVPVPEAATGASAVPFYETYGEQRVAAGAYTHVIRYREHVRPLADALARHVAAAGPALGTPADDPRTLSTIPDSRGACRCS
jgi:hypothetical protein